MYCGRPTQQIIFRMFSVRHGPGGRENAIQRAHLLCCRRSGGRRGREGAPDAVRQHAPCRPAGVPLSSAGRETTTTRARSCDRCTTSVRDEGIEAMREIGVLLVAFVIPRTRRPRRTRVDWLRLRAAFDPKRGKGAIGPTAAEPDSARAHGLRVIVSVRARRGYACCQSAEPAGASARSAARLRSCAPKVHALHCLT